jgi:ribosomal protein L37AE/L43A
MLFAKAKEKPKKTKTEEVKTPVKVENVSTPTITQTYNGKTCPRCKSQNMTQLKINEWHCNDCGGNLAE